MKRPRMRGNDDEDRLNKRDNGTPKLTSVGPSGLRQRMAVKRLPCQPNENQKRDWVVQTSACVSAPAPEQSFVDLKLRKISQDAVKG
jgi:hypothetical protein